MASLNIRQLEAFRALMLSGSVTGAGELLNITQSSVSKLIAQLEADMGILLFERRKGRLFPRPEATALFLPVDKAFGVLEETTRSARKLAKGLAGHMRLVSFPSLGLEFLPSILGEFINARPGVSVEYDIRASSYIEEWVSNRQVDVGFVARAENRPGIVYETLLELNAVFVCHRSHRLAGRKDVRMEELAEEQFISLGRETVLRDMTDRAFLDAGQTRGNIVFETGTSSVACSLAASGTGVAILDPYTALDGWRRGRVSIAKLEAHIPFKVIALTPQNVPQSSLTREFMSLLTKKLMDVHQLIDNACEGPVSEAPQ